jgi:hypothetical protein
MRTFIEKRVKELRNSNVRTVRSKGKFGHFLHEDIEDSERKLRKR